MKFTITEVVEAPQNLVFDHLTQFDRYERMAKDRGADLRKVAGGPGYGVGTAWRGMMEIRGRARPVEAQITGLDRPSRLTMAGSVGGLEVDLVLTATATGPARTTVEVVIDLAANTLTSRLILQSAKLARGRLQDRLEAALARQGDKIETAYRRAGA